MTDGIRKVNLTLPNGATVSAEGTEDYVNKVLDRFAAMLAVTPTVTTTTPKPIGAKADLLPPVDPDALPLDRLFSQEDYYGVALQAKPKSDNADADGILAILYGFAVLKKETTVTAIRLQRAAEKSGLDTPRLARAVAKHAAFITDTGKGKGKRYGLNNPGMTKAVEILRGILG
jgi:hypothetical protein